MFAPAWVPISLFATDVVSIAWSRLTSSNESGLFGSMSEFPGMRIQFWVRVAVALVCAVVSGYLVLRCYKADSAMRDRLRKAKNRLYPQLGASP
jgi:hypothetical protein